MGMMKYTDEGWEDSLLALIANRPQRSRVMPRTLWTSIATRRRGVVQWVAGNRVCLRFCEGRLNAETIKTEEEFLRLYKPL